MRTITLEEHWATASFLERTGGTLTGDAAARQPRLSGVAERLPDLDDLRLREMDAAGIDVQVLSLTAPGVEQLEPDEAMAVARATNDALSAATRRQPGRLCGFAAVPTPAPEAAADELERAVRELGLKGAVINGHVRGRYLDDAFFDPLLERAQALAVPVYLHPALPPEAVRLAYYTGHFSPRVTEMFAMAGWGWHIEAAVHVLRMILGGVFDRHPRLQLIMGHLGETLPFMLERLDHTMPPQATGLDRSIGAYLRENVHYTFSGFNYLPPFLNLLMEVGVDRIMFSADYPYASMAEARTFLERIPVSPAERERVAHRNAETLLGI